MELFKRSLDLGLRLLLFLLFWLRSKSGLHRLQGSCRFGCRLLHYSLLLLLDLCRLDLGPELLSLVLLLLDLLSLRLDRLLKFLELQLILGQLVVFSLVVSPLIS